MEAKDYIEIIAIVLSPVVAVVVTLIYQRVSEKRKEKFTIYFTLMSNRGYLPPNVQFVNALNVIDVVFYNQKNIVKHWHEYRDELHKHPFVVENANRKLLDLLKAISKYLGYPDIEQTSIDQFYLPKVYLDNAYQNSLVQKELLTYLQNANQSGIDTTRKFLEK
jgi:hypothetical protein